MDAKTALEYAQGTLEAWIQGYTDPDIPPGEPQRRVRPEDCGPGWLVIRIEGARFTDEPGRRFRITIRAQELEPS